MDSGEGIPELEGLPALAGHVAEGSADFDIICRALPFRGAWGRIVAILELPLAAPTSLFFVRQARWSSVAGFRKAWSPECTSTVLWSLDLNR